jgi:hypothetical protein
VDPTTALASSKLATLQQQQLCATSVGFNKGTIRACASVTCTPFILHRDFISRRDFISQRDFIAELKSSKSALLGFHTYVHAVV